MKINKLLIFFLSLFAFFIVYLIFFNNDNGSYEKFEVEDTLVEDTQVEDTQEEDTREEDTLEEDTQEEDTQEEDTQVEDTQEDDTINETANDDIIDAIDNDDISYDIIDTTDNDNKKNKNNNSFNDLRKDKLLDTIFEDPLFNDVVLHENNYTTYKSGLDDCIETCNGMCVEFGQTSNAHCYPNPTGAIVKATYYESLRDNTYKTENYDEKTDNFTFPNLR